jgi:hypothetical protein
MSIKQDIAEPGPPLSFQEKSLWVTLLSTLVIYGGYFLRALTAGGDREQVGTLFVTVVGLLVFVQLAAHVVLAAHKRPEGKDERDRQIGLVAQRNAYYVLMTGIWLGLGVASMSLGRFWYAHALLFAVVIAEVTRCGSQLVYYRRGV